MANLAERAETLDYRAPELTDTPQLSIEAGRHPGAGKLDFLEVGLAQSLQRRDQHLPDRQGRRQNGVGALMGRGAHRLGLDEGQHLVDPAAEEAGDGLKGVCQALGIPPVLHMGSCVDISRILSVCAAVANALGVDISDLPVAGAAPEWMSEKAVSIGAYVVSSGIFTVLGTVPPVLGSAVVTEVLTKAANDVVGAAFAVETDPVQGARLMIAHMDKKRQALGI